ncbi:MAG: nucleotidyl transferase AbiEii/AbiGii toxin family protein [Lachnospiraceae bacterium]|nr:nucleotidyl transferase AbiEii/AbiGii toxin family protein [Lachnospiraceae bacterium]
MNLHHDEAVFAELIAGAATELQIPANIIEKDYFVTLTLRELSSRLKNMVFKGGTSLTKCYQLLNRFSEDIDISYTAESGVPGESHKKQLKKAVVATMESLGFTISNLHETQSRRHYNCYRTTYPSVYDNSPLLKPELIVETYVALLPFPTIFRMTDNYLYRFLKKMNFLHIARQYDLMPFPINTQTIERTPVDKIYAICDYYLENKIERHSRHLYDIHKIYSQLKIDKNFRTLVSDVRAARATLSICPSAKENISINALLSEIISQNIYRKDYKEITEGLLFRPLPYEETIATLKVIVETDIFY